MNTTPTPAQDSAAKHSTPQNSTGNARTTFSAIDIALIATFAALIAVSAIAPAIPIGGPVAITLQTFSVLLTGALLGPLRGSLAVLLYMALGAVGLPIFAGGSAGIAPFLGPSVGYLVAMPIAAAFMGLMVNRLKKHSTAATIAFITLIAITATVCIFYPLGILGLAWRADMSLTQAFIFNLAFVPGDMIKAVLVGVVAAAVKRAFVKI